jgi:hypothetical protein
VKSELFLGCSLGLLSIQIELASFHLLLAWFQKGVGGNNLRLAQYQPEIDSKF